MQRHRSQVSSLWVSENWNSYERFVCRPRSPDKYCGIKFKAIKLWLPTTMTMTGYTSIKTLQNDVWTNSKTFGFSQDKILENAFKCYKRLTFFFYKLFWTFMNVFKIMSQHLLAIDNKTFSQHLPKVIVEISWSKYCHQIWQRIL